MPADFHVERFIAALPELIAEFKAAYVKPGWRESVGRLVLREEVGREVEGNGTDCPELMRTLDHEIHDIEQQGFDTITDALSSIRDF